METQKVIMWIYLVISLTTVGVLLYLLIRCKKTTCDNYCICQGDGRSICQPSQRKAYREGKTENSKQVRTIGWNYPSPGGKGWLSNNCQKEFTELAQEL